MYNFYGDNMTKSKIINYYKNKPVFYTDRLILRKLKREDAGDYFEYSNDPLVSRYMLWKPYSSLNYTKQFLNYAIKGYKKGYYYDFAVIEKKTNKLIGMVGYSKIDFASNCFEIGYSFRSDCWHNGFGYEALELLINVSFKRLHVHRLEAVIMEDNLCSQKLISKLGFKYEGTSYDKFKKDEKYVNVKYYSLINTIFE